MHAKKAEDFVEFVLSLPGEDEDSGAVVACYIDVLKKTKKGNVETKCSK